MAKKIKPRDTEDFKDIQITAEINESDFFDLVSILQDYLKIFKENEMHKKIHKSWPCYKCQTTRKLLKKLLGTRKRKIDEIKRDIGNEEWTAKWVARIQKREIKKLRKALNILKNAGKRGLTKQSVNIRILRQ